MSISVLILTLDEESNLPRCLKSVAWSDDIVVLDSFSRDRTVEIAEAAGARVVRRRFDNWAAHQNWAVRNIGFRHPWVYYSDADEVVTPQLRDEALAAVADVSRPEVAYRIRRKDMFMGRWIRRSYLYPTWFLRLFRPDKVRWERLVNPVAVPDGSEGRLSEHFVHYPFSKGLAEWRARHLRYAKAEARETVKSVREGNVDWRGLVSLGPVRRRRALKELSFRLPARPLLRFVYTYFLRMGFLDGWPGFKYCRLMAWYERVIVGETTALLEREGD